jgi:hypothetical protein
MTSTKSQKQIGPESKHYSFSRLMISAVASCNRALVLGFAAVALRPFATVLLCTHNLLTRLRAYVSALLRLLTDKHRNEAQKVVLLRFILQKRVTESHLIASEHRR